MKVASRGGELQRTTEEEERDCGDEGDDGDDGGDYYDREGPARVSNTTTSA